MPICMPYFHRAGHSDVWWVLLLCYHLVAAGAVVIIVDTTTELSRTYKKDKRKQNDSHWTGEEEEDTGATRKSLDVNEDEIKIETSSEWAKRSWVYGSGASLWDDNQVGSTSPKPQ